MPNARILGEGKSMVTEAALPSGELVPRTGKDETAEKARETTPGKEQQVRWEVVAVANGQAEAAIIRGRLEADGIPAQVQQEPAGAAIGLTIGRLGQVKVLVPEPLVGAALGILNQSSPGEEDDAGNANAATDL
jgi:hypothetical protein